MKLNTHSRTPRPETVKLIKGLLILCGVLVHSQFGLGAFALFCYSKSIIGGVFIILLAVFLTTVVFIYIKDIEKAYIEIKANEVYVVDYCFGMKKEKIIPFSAITSAEICLASSFKVKGNRLNVAGTQYIVFKNDKKYLFKIIYLPETAENFKQFLQ